MVIIKLGADVKYRNPKEYRPVPKTEAYYHDPVSGEDVYLRVDGDTSLQNVCKKLLEIGVPGGTLVDVRKEDTQCFTPATVDFWADGGKKGIQPEGLKKYNALRNS